MHLFQPESFLDFCVLELNCRIVLVAIGMVLGQNAESLIAAVFAHKPPWRFGNEEDEADLDERGKTLPNSRHSPRPI